MRDRPTPVNRSIWTCRRSNDLIYAANLQMARATGTVPERVQSRVHTTEPTGPVPEPFHCDHIARWSARSGTTGRSGTGLNTGDWNGSGTVPVPNLWCEHGLSFFRFRQMANVGGKGILLFVSGSRLKIPICAKCALSLALFIVVL